MSTFPTWWPTFPPPEVAAPTAPTPAIWQQLRTELNASHSVPQLVPNLQVFEFTDRSGRHYILKNPATYTYLRLSPQEYWVWERIDGHRSIQHIALEYYSTFRAFAFGAIVGLVQQLRLRHMLTEPPRNVYAEANRALEERHWFNRLTLPARWVFARQWAIPHLDQYISQLYHAGGWVFFTPVVQLILLFLSLTGTGLFFVLLNNPVWGQLDNLWLDVISLGLLAYLPFFIHELGHALTAKHVGCAVPRGGLMFYFGTLAWFVDTTDVWTKGKRARLAVTWAGPYTGFILCGLCSYLLYFWPTLPGAALLFKLAAITLLISVWNLLPLLKLDGYYLLADALEIPRLRERSLDFMRQHLLRKLLKRERWTSDELLFLVFGGLAGLGTAYFIYLGVAVWNARFSRSVAQLLGHPQDLLALAQNLFISLLAVSALLFFGQRLYQGAYTALGWLQRNSRLLQERLAVAWLLLLSALGVGLGWRWLFPDWALVGELVLGLAAYLGGVGLCGWLFTKSQGARLAPMWLMIGTALTLGGVAHLLGSPLLDQPFIQAWVLDAIAVLFLLINVAIGVRWFMGLRGSWRALSAILALAGTLGWIILVLVGPAPHYSQAHLIVGLVLCASVYHWRLCPWVAPPRPPAFDRRATASHHVRQAFSWLAHNLLTALTRSYGRGVTHRVLNNFTHLAHKNGWQLPPLTENATSGTLPLASHMPLTDLSAMLVQALNALLDEAAFFVGSQFVQRALAQGYDTLDWELQEFAWDYILRYVRWATRLTTNFSANILSLLRAVPIFAAFTDEELQAVAKRMRSQYFATGEAIIQQGALGDRFYLLRHGRVTIEREVAGKLETIMECTRGDYFGETALLSGGRRNATIRTLTPVEVLYLGKRDFDRLLRDHFAVRGKVEDAVRRMGLLRQVPIFAEFENFELRVMAARLQTQSLPAEAVVFRQGDPGEAFYIVETGEVRVCINRGFSQVVERARLGPGEYFGEIALLNNTPRVASVITTRPSTLLMLSTQHFSELVRESPSARRALERASTRRTLSNEQWLRDVGKPPKKQMPTNTSDSRPRNP